MRRRYFHSALAHLAMISAVLGSGALAYAQADRPAAAPAIKVYFHADEEQGKAAETASQSSPYKLKPGDTVKIEVAGTIPDQPIAGSHLIDPDGMVRLGPDYGDAKIGGLTIDEARKAVDRQLRQTLREPRVSVALQSAGRGYWVGLQLEPASDALRAQLGLEAGKGLVVEAVVPDSPAAKAGFKQFDLVAELDGQAATSADAFNGIVNQAMDTREIEVSAFRQGKPHALRVRPEQRPAEDATIHFRPEAIHQWERFLPGTPLEGSFALREPMRVELFHPGVVFADQKTAPLPKDVSISISKRGEEAAKIVVKKDTTTWEVTEKELEKLPGEVRPHVERMLGRPSGAAPYVARLHGQPPGVIAHRIEPPKQDVIVRRADPKDTQRQLDEMNERLSAMQKALDELVKDRKQ